MKVLIGINHLAIGGAERAAIAQAEDFSGGGHETYLASVYDTHKETLRGETSLPESSLVDFGFKSIWDIGALFRARRFMKEKDLDIVLTHLFDASTVLRFAAFLAGVPVILAYEHSYYKKRMWQLIVDRLLSYTGFTLGSSMDVINKTAKAAGIAKSRFHFVPTKIEVDVEEVKDKFNIKNELNINKSDFVIVSIGRFVPDKDQDKMLDLAEELKRRKRKNIHLVIVGYGPLEDELRDRIKRDELENARIIIDPNNARKYLLGADVFMLSSSREGVPLTLLEAMLTGLAPLVPDKGGISGVVESGISGYLIDPLRVTDLADLVMGLATNPARLARLSEAAKLGVVEYMNKGSLIKLTKRLLKEKKGE